jgi:hypothetical protein
VREIEAMDIRSSQSDKPHNAKAPIFPADPNSPKIVAKERLVLNERSRLFLKVILVKVSVGAWPSLVVDAA